MCLYLHGVRKQQTYYLLLQFCDNANGVTHKVTTWIQLSPTSISLFERLRLALTSLMSRLRFTERENSLWS